MRVVAKPVSYLSVAYITMCEDEAMAILKMEPPLDVETLQTRIEDCLDRIIEGESYAEHSKTPVAALSMMWSFVVRKLFDWNWIAVEVYTTNEEEFDLRTIGICDSEQRYLLLPEELFQKFVEQWNSTGPRQMISTLQAGQLPPAKRRALFDLGECLI